MNWTEYILGGGAAALLGGIATLYQSKKASDNEKVATLERWNKSLTEKFDDLMEKQDQLIEEVHFLRNRVLTLEIFIRKNDMEPPSP